VGDDSKATRGYLPIQFVDAVLIEDSAEQEQLNSNLLRPHETNPKVLIRHYKATRRQKIQEQLEWFAEHSSLESAISDAALAIDQRGKRFGHQHRIRKIVLQSAKEKLLSIKTELVQCTSFEELHALIASALEPIDGAGKLYIYDVALRIGARIGEKPGLRPQNVFLHAGTRKGAKALGLNSQLSWLVKDSLPGWLRELEPYEVEDFLCIYKKGLADPRNGQVP
jgi:hypothetical protein